MTIEPILCDGCGFLADEEHLRRRIERLELATRFRPIHIGVLFVGDAPTPAREDDFYLPASNRGARSGPARAFFDDLMEGCRIPGAVEKSEEICLNEFQRGSFFLAYIAECPVALGPGSSEGEKQAIDAEEPVRRYGATMIRRIQYSYKPKSIVLLGGRTRPLIAILQTAGFAERLLLDRGEPILIPEANNQAARARFRETLAKIVGGLAAQSRGAL